MDDLALALDLAAHPHHRRAEYGAAVRLENLGPDDEIRDMGLVLERDEHDALGRSRLLAHEHDAGEIDPAPVLPALQRSEERRVGKEGVGKGRSRWCPYH